MAPADTSGLFDELTDTDLSGVKAVTSPGAAVVQKAPGANAAKLLNEAISGADRRGEGMVMKGEAPRPPFLIFLGVVNGLWGLFYVGLMVLFFGLVNMIPAAEEEIPEVEGAVFYLIAAAFGFIALLSFATSVCCFVRGRVPWYIVLVSYGWGLSQQVFTVISEAVSGDADFMIIRSVGGILISGAIWFWLHTESVRAYYGTETEPLWRVAAFDVGGALIGAGLGGAILALS